MAERDSLTGTHIAELYTVDFIGDVLGGKKLLDDDTWNDVKTTVSNPATLESIRQYINKRIIEEKRQPASPASSSGKKGKGLTRVITKDKAKPKAKSRATKKYIVYVQQPMMQPMPQPQSQPQPQTQPQPVATGSGKHRRQKAVSRLKPIQEEEVDIRTIIKPARNHLPSGYE